MHSRRSQAPAHSAAGRRCTQRTAEVQRRQLRHPSEARCQRRCPSFSDPVACTHRRPSARPLPNPPPATALRATAPARSTHHHRQRIPGVCKYPPTAQLAPDARSVQLRYSDVSCVIPPRLGASDAAPAAPKSLSARTAGPRLAPRKPPTTRSSPVRIRPSPKHAASSMHSRRSQAPAHSTAPADASSVLLRSSDVSCVILPRLGASDAAPSSPIQLPARTAAPKPSRNPHHPLMPRVQPPQPHHPCAAGVRKHPLTAQAQPMHAAYG
jgi:hypothetical protein